MKILITGPVNLISSRLYSHKSAEGWILYDMIKTKYTDDVVDIETSDNIIEDYLEYDKIYLYHGNDFSGSLNLFGGLKNEPVARQLAKISLYAKYCKFNNKEIISCKIPMPDYGFMVYNRLKSQSGYPEIWDNIDLAELTKLSKQEDYFDPANNFNSKKLVLGDSHAISMYRAGWAVNSVPFQTLNGAINRGLESFIPQNLNHYDSLEFYFGNIDIRHHIYRLSKNLDEAKGIVNDLVIRYVNQIKSLNIKNASIYVPLPIENESRVVPKSGWHKGKPFWGSWHDRDFIRGEFIDRLYVETNNTNIKVLEWTDYLENSKDELDFAYMEKPRSVHLSREFYPHWTGKPEVVSEATGLF